VHAAEGDFRDWAAIRAWTQRIGEALIANHYSIQATPR
jgi:hypothetical protein